jgi:hypothetical protein
MSIDGQQKSLVAEDAPGPASVNGLIEAALADPGNAEESHPGYRLQRLVTLRLDMDEVEIGKLADLTGVAAKPLAVNADALFDENLRAAMARAGLWPLFEESGPGLHHQAIRPTGYLYHFDEVDALGMEAWRAYYRSMAPARQMLAASIIWLFRGRKDKTWLRRVPCAWHAAQGIAEMRRAGLLQDWAKLIVRYPGW